MKPTQKTILLSYVLILPAVTLVTSGLLYLLFGWEQANNFLGALLNHGLTRPLLSPVVVLGGAFVAVLLNAPQLCHFQISRQDRELFISLRLTPVLQHWVPLLIGLLLLFLLFSYAFVENFQVIAREAAP